jgi:predicted phosphodiesterase
LLTLVVPDVHVPFHDKRRVAAMLAWAKRNKPGKIVLLGDVLDLHALTTHRQDPRWQDQLEKELEAGRRFLADLRGACPRADITYIEGNHEDRWNRYVAGRIPAMRLIGVDLARYLGLADLGIRWHNNRRKGVPVPCGQGKTVHCFHGHEANKSSKFPGGVAIALAEKCGQNIHIGHTHKLGLQCVVLGGRELFGVEGGHLVNPKASAFGYAGINPQWTAAWAVYDSEATESPFPKFYRP